MGTRGGDWGYPYYPYYYHVAHIMNHVTSPKNDP
jgi:hypothetical protein